jgi:hypothetical protein
LPSSPHWAPTTTTFAMGVFPPLLAKTQESPGA